MTEKEVIVRLADINKSYGDNHVVRNLNIDIYIFFQFNMK